MAVGVGWPSAHDRLGRMKPWLPVAAVLLALSPLAVVRPVRVSGRSMEPALKDGSLHFAVLAWATHAPQRGEIWVVRGPDGASAKRVVGLPGETLDQLRGDLRLAGRLLVEPYVSQTEREDGGPWQCGKGYLLLGDNRPESRDSRAWGPLPAAAFKARLLWRN